MADLSIRKVLEQVQNGQLRIPAFQRGFVWDADRVAYLMDSIHKGYPFGALILWRTKEQLKIERQLGPFKIPDREADFPVDYVLDGQQRLTSIFGVFQTEIETELHEDDAWTKVYYDFQAEKDVQESQFLVLPDDQVDPARHFPIGSFFDVSGFRAATEGLSAPQLEEIDRVQAVFKEADIPVQMIETDDRAKVAIVFERVNRMGVELDIFQLLSAWTWSEEFDLQDKFADLAEDLKPFGFAAVGEDSNLLLRCCSAVIGGDATSSGLLGLNGAEVRDRFDEITNGIKGAVDFLRSNLKVEKLDNLPYPTLIVPLAVYFAAPNAKSVKVTNDQRDELVRWFWRACFSRRFSAGVLRNLSRDVAEVLALRKSGTPGIANIPWSVDRELFTESRFTAGSVATKTFILMLAQYDPLSFVSGSPVALGDVLRHYNRKEFHHINPQKFLKGQGRDIADVNRLANFAIISASDNKTLGGTAPSGYKSKMPAKSLDKILASALCPLSVFDDDYEAFLIARGDLLVDAAKTLAS
ncbi:GmrSD restriction endonuclease domain-containing protein [Microbacterium sp. T32]|uniref:GmrSD restriction endonuclease domain-containing protein n=1 Tax=Microbacterium sp. T32 TaxID=1776083 RepID=UPI0007AB78B8|nr:DUF262 domain-containing protein [Microbacterium sp. T32]KZE42903.1 hypothetical protein AVW09_08385 [Microbacterium sp. T32]